MLMILVVDTASLVQHIHNLLRSRQQVMRPLGNSRQLSMGHMAIAFRYVSEQMCCLVNVST